MIHKNKPTIKVSARWNSPPPPVYSSVYRAYAKINLGLRIRRKRDDGYHDIETIFHRIDLYDELVIRPSESIRVTSSDPSAPGGPENIAHRAATMVQQTLQVTAGADIAIAKRIPVGAGLGGGSSDAAVVLQQLPQHWGGTIPHEELRSLALSLGSDVPYFLQRGSASARGRGEQLEYFILDIPFAILLCNPGIHVSTPWAYQHVHPSRDPIDLRTAIARGLDDPQYLSRAIVNDFEPVVFREYPAVKSIKETMLAGGAVFSLMSGSGSSVYGFYAETVRMTAVSEELASRGFRVFHTAPHFSPAE
jgi:4-diphosphocytidyl-2-C-methyl-D-erythritol kinase